MTKRNTPTDIKSVEDLSDLQRLVIDKRREKRAEKKRNRRDRHYNKSFIKAALKDHLQNRNDVMDETETEEL